MNKRELGRKWIVAAAMASLTAFGGLTPAAAQDPAGWSLLWTNKIAAARTHFESVLTHSPNDPDALRGAGWAAYYQDDQAAAIRDWSRAITLRPTDWTSAGVWSIVTGLAESSRHFDPLDTAATAITQTPSAPLMMKLNARMVVEDSDERHGAPAAAAAVRKTMGLITDWNVVGPFDNTSKSGYDTAYEPEHIVDFKAQYTGKDDIPLLWRRCPLVDRTGTVMPARFLGDNDPNVFYAVTSVFVAQDIHTHVIYGTSCASRVYLNGAPVLSDPIYRSMDLDIAGTFDLPVTLHSGWNSLVIKLSDDEKHSASFRFAIVDSAGNPISVQVDPNHAEGCRLDADNSQSSTATAVTARTSPDSLPPTDALGTGADLESPTHVVWLDTVVGDHRSTPEGTLALARFLDDTEDYQGGETLLRAALRKTSGVALFHWELSLMLSFDGQTDDARSERDAARTLTHGVEAAELDYMDDQKSSAQASERVSLLRSLHAAFPNSINVGFDLSEALLGASMDGEAYTLAHRYLADYGTSALQRLDSGDYTNSQAQIDQLLAHAVMADALDEGLWQDYEGKMDDRKQTSQALDACRHLMRIEPAEPNYVDGIAAVSEEAGDLKQAVVYYTRLTQMKPQDPDALASLGGILEQEGRKSDAVATYRRAIALNPGRNDLRDKIQMLTGQKPVLDLVPPMPTPDLRKIAGKPNAGDPPIVEYVDDERMVVYPDYSTVAEIHSVMKINSDAVAQEMQEYPLERESSNSVVTLEQARLVKADGKIEDHNGDSTESLSFPSLAVGDVIDVSYRVEDRNHGALARQFWRSWYFGGPESQNLNSRFALITPANLSYRYVCHNGAAEPVDTLHGAWRVRQWSQKNGPAYKVEQLEPDHLNWVPWVDVSTVDSWSQIVDWYEFIARPRCVPDSIIRAKAADLTQGATTVDDKIMRLVHYVSHDVQYQSTPFRLSAYVPTEGKQVIRERYGDCKDKAALLVAMLDSLGIQAHMVLLTPGERGDWERLPSPRFSHAIAVVETVGGPLWIDGTADQLAYRYLPANDQGIPALIIAPGTHDLQTSPNLDNNGQLTVNYEVTLQSSGAAEYQVQDSFTGEQAWQLRSVLNRVTSDKLNDVMNAIGQVYMGVQPDTHQLTGLDDREAPLGVAFTAHDDNFATSADQFLMVGLPWSQALPEDALSRLSLSGRVHDIDLRKAGVVEDVSIQLPAGYSAQGLKPELDGGGDWGNFVFRYTEVGGALQAHAEIHFNSVVLPVSKVPAFAADLQTIREEAQRKIVFKKD